MPYAPNPSFTPPEQDSITIWRYMDFAKFMWTIQRSALYFCRVDQLPDPLEGRMLPSMRSFDKTPEMPPQSRRFVTEMHLYMEYQARAGLYVNCWSMNEHESVAMWQYGKGEYGVALRSRYSRLRSSFDRESRNVFIGTVIYGDIARGQRRICASEFVLRKEKWWNYEHELRAATSVIGEQTSGDQTPKSGLEISVDLDVLVESVYVAPTAPLWFVGVVEEVLRRYDLTKPVVPSPILREPASLPDSAG